MTQSSRSVRSTVEICAIFRCLDLPLKYEIRDGLVSGPDTYRVKVVAIRNNKGVLEEVYEKTEVKSAAYIKEYLRMKFSPREETDATSVGSYNREDSEKLT